MSPRLNGRDIEYVWNRLSSPCMEALDAHARLVERGFGVEAGELMVAMQTFTDECRRIRLQVSRRNAGEVME